MLSCLTFDFMLILLGGNVSTEATAIYLYSWVMDSHVTHLIKVNATKFQESVIIKPQRRPLSISAKDDVY